MTSEAAKTLTRLLTRTAEAATSTAELLGSGRTPEEAVLVSGILNLFDGGSGVSSLATDIDLSPAERRRVLSATCAELAEFCQAATPDPAATRTIVARIVAHFREVAACVPDLVEDMCARGEDEGDFPVFGLGFDLGGELDLDQLAASQRELRAVLAPALIAFGADAVRAALEGWEPGSDEAARISEFLRAGDSVAAMRFVFTEALRTAGLDLDDGDGPDGH